MAYEAYYEKTKDEPPNRNIIWFLNREVKPGVAVDLGCGAGRDTVCLLKHGWTVYAVDSNNCEQLILEKLTDEEKNRFKYIQKDMKDVEIPKCDLVVANYSLHKLKKEEFREIIGKIYNSLNSGGHFVAVFLGDKDTWATDEKRKGDAYFSFKELKSMMEAKFGLVQIQPSEFDGETVQGERKHWHTFTTILRCRNKNLKNTKIKRDEEER